MNRAISILALACGFLLGVITGPWLWPSELLRAFMDEASVTQQAITALPTPEPEPPPPPPPPPEPPPPESELVLKGVFVGGDVSRALIAYGDEAPRPYKLDDKLPDGSVLRAINSKDVEVEKNGETRTLPLDRGTPATEAVEPDEVAEVEAEPEITAESPDAGTAAGEATEEAQVEQPPESAAPDENEGTATP